MTMKTLAELRRKAGFTQKSLAAEMGICPAVVSKWERGTQMPSYDNLSQLRKLFRCSYDDLLEY